MSTNLRSVLGSLHAPGLDAAFRGQAPVQASLDGETARYLKTHAAANKRLLESIEPRLGSNSPGAAARARVAKAAGLRTADLSGGTVYSNPIPYRYPSESPERAWYPDERAKSCQLARDVYRDDELIGTGVDMITEMAFGEFDISGEDIDGEIRSGYEAAINDCQVMLRLPEMAREYLIPGEAAVQNIWDDTRGHWRRTYLHRSEDLIVYDCGLFMDEPVVQYKTPPYIRELLTKDHPMLKAQRRKIPRSMLEPMLQGKPITLEPANFTFIPRKMSSGDARGTSLMTRLWRAVVYQDAIFAAAIQTARRMALPLKILKLGDPSANYYPTPEQEVALLSKVAEQELDPGSWLTWSWALSAELVGVQERALPITQHAPLIETMKLSALGINRAIILGEASYSSSAAGLTVFLQRLLALRNLFVRKWLIPKFFGMMAVANGWKRKPKKSDPERKSRGPNPHRAHYRVGADSDQAFDLEDYIIPEVIFKKTLDPNVNSERIGALGQLKPLGASLAPQDLYALAGSDFEEACRLKLEADEIIQRVSKGDPRKIALLMGTAPGAGGDGGGGGFGGMPPILPGTEGLPSADDLGSAPPPEVPGGEPGPGEAPPDAAPPTAAPGKPHPNLPAGGVGDWPDEFVDAGVRLFTTFDHTEVLDLEPWDEIVADPRVTDALADADGAALWDAVESVLAERGSAPKQIAALSDALTSSLRRSAMQRSAAIVRHPQPARELVRVATNVRMATLQSAAMEQHAANRVDGNATGASFLVGAD